MTTNSGHTIGDTPIGSSIGSDRGGDTGTGTGSVAGTAKEEAVNVASTAAQEARGVVGEAVRQVSDQVGDQATTQRDRLSETLRTLGDDLEKMAAGEGAASGMAADLVREVSDRARSMGSHLENREPGQLVDDARDFARRRPGTFLLGALVAGVAAGRLFRATADGAAAASLVDTGAGTAGTTGTMRTPSAAGTPASYAAPVPSLAGDTGTGYGTGPGGTGSGAEALDPNPTLTQQGGTDFVPPSSYGQRTQDTP